MDDVQVEGSGQAEQKVEIDMGAAQAINPGENTGTESTEQEQKAEGDEPDAGTQQERDANGQFKPKAGVQARIDELTRAKHEAAREAAYWRGLAQQQGTAQPSAQAAPEKPTPDKYDDYNEYIEALTDWKAAKAVNDRMEQESARKVGEVRAQTFMERQAEFSKATPDYAKVMSESNAPIAKHVIEAAQESEVGPQLLYHFAQNPDVLDRINRMDERTANREIGRLEATLSSKATAAPAPPAKKLTNAPPPAATQSSQGRTNTPTLADADMETYMAQRKAQGARWAR